MPSSDDEDLLPSFKPAWAQPGGIPKRARPAAARLPQQRADGRSGGATPVRGDAERWPAAGASRMADGYAAGDGGTGGGRLPEAAGVGVFRRVAEDVEFLLLCSNKTGGWTPPKGHLEASESAEVAALRELREETGIVLSTADLDSRCKATCTADLGSRSTTSRPQPLHVTKYYLPRPTRKCPTGFKETNYFLAEVPFILNPSP